MRTTPCRGLRWALSPLLVLMACYSGRSGRGGAGADGASGATLGTAGTDGSGESDGGSDGGDEPPHPSDACPAPAPAHITLHRLNRAEYDNTVRDLLGLDLRLAATFPAENHVEGFDNNADGLTISPLHLEKYMAAAETAATAVLADPTAKGRVMVCEPTPGDERACAQSIFTAFLPRAYRRPVSQAEIDEVVNVAMVPLGNSGTFEEGLALAMRAVLLSPNFLYRPEPPPPGTAPGESFALDDYALASRLSYFLWSSMPDDELFELAARGELQGATAVAEQVERMVADPKAQAFVRNFAGQWLHSRAMADARPNADLFPDFDEALRTSMEEEVYAFFAEILAGEPVTSLLTADFVMADGRLAEHYDLPAGSVSGSGFTRVAVDGGERGGILRQGSFLSVTSHPTRTSPVKRGKWVVQQLLCLTPPPPPPGVEQLPQELDEGATLREIFEQHRADPACAGCHVLMDPIGFGLEHYDAVGKLRELDNGQVIDASGSLPGAGEFTNAAQLSALIAEDPRFTQCMTKNLFTYALGRGMTAEDQCEIDAVAAELEVRGQDLVELLIMVATSPTTTHQVAQEQ